MGVAVGAISVGVAVGSAVAVGGITVEAAVGSGDGVGMAVEIAVGASTGTGVAVGMSVEPQADKSTAEVTKIATKSRAGESKLPIQNSNRCEVLAGNYRILWYRAYSHVALLQQLSPR